MRRSGLGFREIARQTGFSRVTVRKYINGDGERAYRRQKEPERRVLEQGHMAQLSLWYEADLTRPKRERRSAHRLYDQLVLEGYEGSYTTVQRYIRLLKREKDEGHLLRLTFPWSLRQGRPCSLTGAKRLFCWAGLR